MLFISVTAHPLSYFFCHSVSALYLFIAFADNIDA
jgi:hypothetical protein